MIPLILASRFNLFLSSHLIFFLPSHLFIWLLCFNSFLMQETSLSWEIKRCLISLHNHVHLVHLLPWTRAYPIFLFSSLVTHSDSSLRVSLLFLRFHRRNGNNKIQCLSFWNLMENHLILTVQLRIGIHIHQWPGCLLDSHQGLYCGHCSYLLQQKS